MYDQVSQETLRRGFEVEGTLHATAVLGATTIVTSFGNGTLSTRMLVGCVTVGIAQDGRIYADDIDQEAIAKCKPSSLTLSISCFPHMRHAGRILSPSAPSIVGLAPRCHSADSSWAAVEEEG